MNDISAVRPFKAASAWSRCRIKAVPVLGAAALFITLASGQALEPEAAGAHPAEPVRIYNTHGFEDETQWTQVTGTPDSLDPRETVIQNGLIRLRYPCGRVERGEGQTGSWLVYLKQNGSYELAQDGQMGDWLYVGSSMVTQPTGFAVGRNEDELVSVRMEFDNHVHQKLDPPVPCGVRKTLILASGHYGYIVHVTLSRDDLRGEKESGFGASARHRFFYNHSGGHLRPDNTETTVYPRKQGQPDEWWAAGLPTDKSFFRLLAVRPAFPGALRTAQWSPGMYGYFYQWIYKPAPAFEVYIAVVPYDGRKAAEIAMEGGSAIVTVPKDGVYSIYSRGENALYKAVLPELALTAGTNRVALNGVTLEDPRIAPISNGRDFPEDICRNYRILCEQLTEADFYLNP